MTPENRCEIPGCGCLVMGCELDDACPATRLCHSHYFLMKWVCDPKSFSLGPKPIALLGWANHWEKQKVRQWQARYLEDLSGVARA